MKIQPNNGQHVIQFDPKEKAIGAVVLSDQAQTRPNTGTVLSASKGYYTNRGAFVPSLIKTGQRVIVAKLGGVKTEVENVYIVKEGDILGVIDNGT